MNYKLGLATGIILSSAIFYNIPKPAPITKEVVRVLTVVEQIEVPRAPTWEESVEALQITLDGTYKSLKRKELTNIDFPPTPTRKPIG